MYSTYFEQHVEWHLRTYERIEFSFADKVGVQTGGRGVDRSSETLPSRLVELREREELDTLLSLDAPCVYRDE